MSKCCWAIGLAYPLSSLKTLLKKFKAFQLPLTRTKRTFLCGHSPRTDHSLLTQYLLTEGLNLLNLEATLGHWVWKSSTTPRIKFFLWLCVHCSIPTCEVLGSRGINLNITCELCGLASKSILHTLRDCEKARCVWKDLGIEESNVEFFNLSLTDWLEKYCSSFKFFPRPCIPWKILFP